MSNVQIKTCKNIECLHFVYCHTSHYFDWTVCIHMVGMDYFILIYATCLTVICSVFISIGTYLLLMLDESNPKSEGRIFLLKTFNFRFQMIISLILSLNGIHAVLFESFSLLRLSFAFGHGWLALKLARNLQKEKLRRLFDRNFGRRIMYNQV